MSNEQNGKPPAAAPSQDDLSRDLGLSIFRSAYGGFGVNFNTGENVSNHGGSIAREAAAAEAVEAAQTVTNAGVAEAGKAFAILRNQMISLEKKLADQADEMTWLRTERAKGNSNKKKGKK